MILETVSTAGVLAVALVAPNVIGAMNKLGILPNPRRKEYVSSAASKLVKRGLMKFKDGYYQLTREGKNLLNRWKFSDYKLKKPAKWDKKWRMIIFDIPEKKKNIRRKINFLFNQAGLYRLQDSVWIYPYDCENIIGLLKTESGVGKEMLYVIADEIENDKYLQIHFDLQV